MKAKFAMGNQASNSHRRVRGKYQDSRPKWVLTELLWENRYPYGKYPVKQGRKAKGSRGETAWLPLTKN